MPEEPLFQATLTYTAPSQHTLPHKLSQRCLATVQPIRARASLQTHAWGHTVTAPDKSALLSLICYCVIVTITSIMMLAFWSFRKQRHSVVWPSAYIQHQTANVRPRSEREVRSCSACRAAVMGTCKVKRAPGGELCSGELRRQASQLQHRAPYASEAHVRRVPWWQFWV